MQSILDFLTSTGGKIAGLILAALVVIIVIAWVDRHPKRKIDPPPTKEPPRDDE